MHPTRAVNQHVDLAPHAELVLIDAGLNREAGPRQEEPVFTRFQAVHVGAVAVNFLADVVAGAMDELRAISGLFDHRASCVINLPARDRFSLGESLHDDGDARIPRGGDDLENTFVLFRYRDANVANSCEIAIDAARAV